MRLLVFGKTGQVGHELLRIREPGVTMLGLGRAEVDLERPADVARAVREAGCDIVVNAAAHTAVDQAESEPESAFAINRDAPGAMAAACAERGIPLIHISTDYVFDGGKAGAYTEDDPVNPMGVYGASKEAGERAVREALTRHVILRTSWVFSAHGRNFVKTMLRLGADRPELRIVADQHGCPTAAADIAAAVVAVARRLDAGGDGLYGTYHYSGAGRTTWHGFASAVFDLRREIAGTEPPVLHAITTADFPTPAKRPANSELNCSKIAQRLGVEAADWRGSLAKVMRELLETQGAS